MEFKNLLLEIADGIALLTINRPEVRNALDLATVNEMHAALDRLREQSGVGVLIITGAGDKSFVSGADIRELRLRDKFDALRAINGRLFSAVEKFELPTIAAVNGYALGGGCELAIACDLRIASENARFGLPETGLGIIPGGGGTQRLPRLVGLGKAKELILTGEIITAAEAERIGLVNRVVPQEKLLEAVRETARKILSRGPLATRLAKLALNLSSEVGRDAGLLYETIAQAVLFESKDKYEAMTAFLEKRKPNWSGK